MNNLSNCVQVKCSYQYLELVDSDNYKFLPAQLLKGVRTSLSPKFNSILATCRRVSDGQANYH